MSTGIISTLVDNAMLLIEAAIGIGLILAVGQLVLGHREGIRNLVIVGGVALGLALWKSGQLATIVHGLVHSLG